MPQGHRTLRVSRKRRVLLRRGRTYTQKAHKRAAVSTWNLRRIGHGGVGWEYLAQAKDGYAPCIHARLAFRLGDGLLL